MARIESRPGEALCYDPNEPKYWQRPGLERERERVFDICQGCRLCFNLCPSFAALFGAVDRRGGDVRELSSGERQRVVELCYGCRLCEIKCPYTPGEGHEFQLDFPRLMLRARAAGVRERGLKMRERLLGNPDLLGRIGAIAPSLANRAVHSALQRRLAEATLGIHRDKKLPDFAAETFRKWLDRRGLAQPPAQPAAKVAIFHTCIVNYHDPAPGKAAVEVLEKNGCQIRCPEQNCCGMPALDGGDIEFARRQARDNVAALLPLVREGYRVAAINPTCSLMMRREYPTLLGGEDARAVAAAVADTNELLFQLRRQGVFNHDFRSSPRSVAYHVPCHLKAQGIGLRSRDLMRTIPETEVVTVDACTGHDGTWAMKKEFFALSMEVGARTFNALREAGAQIMATDCPLAAVQIEQATGTHPLHPLEVLARAYRADGFAHALARDASDSSDPKEKP